jgi:hypothetical protein
MMPINIGNQFGGMSGKTGMPITPTVNATAAPQSLQDAINAKGLLYAGPRVTGQDGASFNMPIIRASDVQNGKFMGSEKDYGGMFNAANMGAHGDNYQFGVNQDGTLKMGVKTGGTNRLDTTYVKQGDYYVPQNQQNQYWDTGSGGFLKNTLKQVAPIASLAAMAIPGLQPFALGLNAVNAGMNGNWKGALMSALPVAGQVAGAGSNFMNVANGLQSANSGYNAVKNLQNGNYLGALGAGAAAFSGANNIFGGSQANSQLAGLVGKGAGVAQNVQKGNYLGALSGGLGAGGYGQAAGALNMANSIYNLTQQRGTPMKQGPVRTVQPMMFGNSTARG